MKILIFFNIGYLSRKIAHRKVYLTYLKFVSALIHI
jgi:hypothetical protein